MVRESSICYRLVNNHMYVRGYSSEHLLCSKCRGTGNANTRTYKPDKDCLDCQETGIMPIPFTELFQ